MNTMEWKGELITEPGVWRGIPIDRYHRDCTAAPSISSSGLRTIWAQSPLHFWTFSHLNPDRVEPQRSDAFDLGKAAHHWLLGEADFAKHFVLSPYDDFRTKEAREWRDAERAAGRVVLTTAQMEDIRGMRAGLLRNPLVQAGILDGEVERSLIWEDKETGVWLRSRPDVMPNNSGDHSDLKTTTSVWRHDLAKAIATWNYPMQAALLRMGCRALDLPFTSFAFVFVEKTAPWCCRVVQLKDEELARGEKQVRAAIRIFADCLFSGEWPGPDGDQTDAEWIEQPAWAQTQIDERLRMLAEAQTSRTMEAPE